jgi:hypothetical protein
MTLARPIRAALLAGLVAIAQPALAVGASVAPIGTGERVVSDPLTGTALYGFDPVAYFADGKARGGSSAYEAVLEGVVWRFVNAANRAAFLADPQVYRPAFGGYDPEAVSRGVLVATDPTLFALVSGRLMLFRSVEARSRFMDRQLLTAANAAWSRIEPTLLH